MTAARNKVGTAEVRKNRIPFMMTDDELRRLDDWRFKNKITTRAEAIRQIVAEATDPNPFDEIVS